MRVTANFRCPDEGEQINLVLIDEDANVTPVSILRRRDLALLRPLLVEALDQAADGGHDFYEVEAWKQMLHAVDELAKVPPTPQTLP